MIDKVLKAIEKQNLELIKKFHRNDELDLSFVDNNGNNLIHYAALVNNKDVIEYFNKCGIDISLKNNDENTPLDIAIKGENIDVIKYIYEYNKSVNEDNEVKKITLISISLFIIFYYIISNIITRYMYGISFDSAMYELFTRK